MATIHISEADAAKDFAGLMARVRAGEEVVIDDGKTTFSVMREPDTKYREESVSAPPLPGKVQNSTATLDADFVRDLKEAMASNSSVEPRPVRLLSESLRILKHRGSSVTLDADFGRDLEEAIASHPEPLNFPWD